MIKEKDISIARHDIEKFGPLAAMAEAEFKDLERREPIVKARCIAKYRGPRITYQWAKNEGIQDKEYVDHLEQMKKAEKKYLEAEKAYRTIVEWLRAVTSENYRENSRLKAGL